ncbi:MAG: hypothetical protein KFH98_16010 [Gemmatimonadetes bacterium]|nr:hypothetical protein [Gemmatimonadota bacterium]
MRTRGSVGTLHEVTGLIPRNRRHGAAPRARGVIVALALVVGGGGCGQERDPTPATAADAAIDRADGVNPQQVTRDTARSADADANAELMGAEWTVGDTRVDRPVTGAAMLREMRTARHDDFDRVVLDFGGDPVPGYRIAYIDRPVRQCGSGNVVPLAGDAWLSIIVEPANAHTEAGEPTVRERERTPALPSLLELKLICDFEAIVEVVGGLGSPERYRAFVLENPGRLVIDIMHPS